MITLKAKTTTEFFRYSETLNGKVQPGDANENGGCDLANQYNGALWGWR